MERRGSSSTSAAGASAKAHPSKMDAEEYLDRYGVTAYMKDVVTLLLENRPPEPIDFIADYFRTVIQGSSPLLRAYRYVRLAQPHQKAFTDNLVAAYCTLDAACTRTGVSGVELQRLLELVSSDGHLDISRALLVLLGKRDADAVDFGAFAAAVQSCLLYHELFAEAERMFAACDVHGTGRVRRSVLAVVQEHLAQQSAADAERALQGGGDAGGGGGGGDRGRSSPTTGIGRPAQVAVEAEELRKLDGAEAACLRRQLQCEVADLRAALRAAAPPPTSDDEGYTLHAFLVAVFAATIADGATAEAACQVLGVPDVPPEVAHTLGGK